MKLLNKINKLTLLVMLISGQVVGAEGESTAKPEARSNQSQNRQSRSAFHLAIISEQGKPPTGDEQPITQGSFTPKLQELLRQRAMEQQLRSGGWQNRPGGWNNAELVNEIKIKLLEIKQWLDAVTVANENMTCSGLSSDQSEQIIYAQILPLLLLIKDNSQFNLRKIRISLAQAKILECVVYQAQEHLSSKDRSLYSEPSEIFGFFETVTYN